MEIIILICSGLLVGFINTLAGGGTIISLSVFMFLGLPPLVANGTNRVAVLLQNITSVANFQRKNLIDWKRSFRLMIPIILGALVGAVFAKFIPNTVFSYLFGVIAIFIALALILRPNRWFKEREDLLANPLHFWQYLLFFFIGIYGGLVHVGVGYFVLAVIVLSVGHDLVRANAMKNVLILAYIPFSLAVFAFSGYVDWKYGLIHGCGNVLGAQIASFISVRKSFNWIRYLMILITFIIVLQLFGYLTPEKLSAIFR